MNVRCQPASTANINHESSGVAGVYEDTCNSNVPVNMLYHLCVGIVALITVLTGTNFRAERTQTKGDTTCNRTLELQVSSYSRTELIVRWI